MSLSEQIISRKVKVGVIGLGYVGLPVALEFARQYKVIGFDINEARVEMMRKGIDPSKELDRQEFEGCDIAYTANPSELADAKFFVVAVPTPINKYNQPDLNALLSACRTVGKVLKKGDYVVFESTVYPGCTEEDCVPILEQESGLKFKTDFKVGYSPERINPGDREHTLTRITKVVAGCDHESAEIIADVYGRIITAGIHKASTIKVAEAAKVIENTQRDINIAFMNELSLIFRKMDINIYEVLEAARTKWNFLNFYPGLVGGHCIGVDPYYLTYKAGELGHHAKVILSGRQINDAMGADVAQEAIRMMIAQDKSLKQARVLVMGATFKENVADIRNTRVVDIVDELRKFYVNVDVTDPHADSEEFEHEYGYGLTQHLRNDYDAIIVAVAHNEYQTKDEAYFKSLTNAPAVFWDVKGIFKDKIKDMAYMSL